MEDCSIYHNSLVKIQKMQTHHVKKDILYKKN